jgi:hypothetical protein
LAQAAQAAVLELITTELKVTIQFLAQLLQLVAATAEAAQQVVLAVQAEAEELTTPQVELVTKAVIHQLKVMQAAQPQHLRIKAQAVAVVVQLVLMLHLIKLVELVELVYLILILELLPIMLAAVAVAEKLVTAVQVVTAAVVAVETSTKHQA